MSGAVPPPQPPYDPDQPPGYSGEAGPNDPPFGGHPNPIAPQGAPQSGGYSDPGSTAAYAQNTAPSSSSSSVRADQAKAALKGANPLDWAIIGAGALAFLLSLFGGYYTYKVTIEGEDSLLQGALGVDNTSSFNAWHGFLGWFAAVMALAAAVLMVLGLMGVIANRTVLRLGVAAAFGVAALSVLLALLVVPGSDENQSFGGVSIDVDPGHGITYWLSLVVILAGAALAALRMRAKD